MHTWIDEVTSGEWIGLWWRKIEGAFLIKGTAHAKANQSPKFVGSALDLGNLIHSMRSLEEGLREARTTCQRKCDKSPELSEGLSNAHSGIW